MNKDASMLHVSRTAERDFKSFGYWICRPICVGEIDAMAYFVYWRNSVAGELK